MPEWSTTKHPMYLDREHDSVPGATNVFATSKGWVQRHYKGLRYWDEVIIAMTGVTSIIVGGSAGTLDFSAPANSGYIAFF
jgi:hypothetical protein